MYVITMHITEQTEGLRFRVVSQATRGVTDLERQIGKTFEKRIGALVASKEKETVKAKSTKAGRDNKGRFQKKS